jgi:hypothetical protein
LSRKLPVLDGSMTELENVTGPATTELATQRERATGARYLLVI